MTTTWWTKPRGGAGWLAMGGMAAGIATWWPIAVAAGGGWFALAMRGYGRSRRALAHLERAFPGTERSAPHDMARLSGKLDDMPFEIRDGTDTLHVLIATPVPEGLTIDHGRGFAIGDPAFDARFRVVADDPACELWWRLMLTAELRARFCALFAGAPVVLRDGWLDIIIDDADAHGPTIERWIREGVALGRALRARLDVDDGLVAFVDQIPREPLAAVRRTHYEWLVTGGYEVPALLHLAAQDPDPEIRSWAQGQRPSETLYR